jgi:3-deoxy-7-phosphoheptulonate synthase
MIILMKLGATREQVAAVSAVIREHGLEALELPGEDRVAVGIPSVVRPEDRPNLEAILMGLDGVSMVTQTSRPYKRASIEFQGRPTTVEVKGAKIGPGMFTIMGGPCSVESYDQFREAARLVKESGAQVLRGGAFKPRTSPYSFQGLAEEGLKIMKSVGEEFGLVTVSEVMSGDLVPVVAEHVDILQIGARSMQNFPLLIEAGRSKKPVFLKRGPAATLDEFLFAAEYVLNEGNPNVILCERGVVPLDRSYTRNTLDLNAVPVLKEVSHLPVVVDPSHGTGVARYVAPLAKAALVAGADGVMIEMHPDPRHALSDGSQALPPAEYAQLVNELWRLADYIGRAR